MRAWHSHAVTRPLHYDPNHPVFSDPPGSTRLWRYLDFIGAIALLESRTLFLSERTAWETPLKAPCPRRPSPFARAC